MKLLIVTQRVDRSDPILGFFHRWLELLAARTTSLTVITQSIGNHALPSGTTVHALGKQYGRSKAAQIIRFWSLLWKLKGEYDCVLVHMTPVWVILGWPVWKLLRKRVYLWYEIRRGSWRLTLALLLIRKVFTATVQGLPAPHRKQVVTGHGIDTDIFSPDVTRREGGCIVAVGRITRSKRYDVILRAFSALPSTCRLVIAGGMVTQADEGEWEALQRQMQELGIAGRVTVSWVDPSAMAALYRRADLLLHACAGGLDKAVLEAMACGCLVVSSSEAAQQALPQCCRALPESMGGVALRVLALPAPERTALSAEERRTVTEHHSLPKLIQRLVGEMA